MRSRVKKKKNQWWHASDWLFVMIIVNDHTLLIVNDTLNGHSVINERPFLHI